MNSRVKRLAVMVLAAVLAVSLAVGMALAFGVERNAFAAAETLTLDFDGTEASVSGVKTIDPVQNAGGAFTGGSITGYVISTAGTVADKTEMTIAFGQSITVADYTTTNIHLSISNWTTSTTTVTGYAASDTEFATPLGSTNAPFGAASLTLSLDMSKISDETIRSVRARA